MTQSDKKILNLIRRQNAIDSMNVALAALRDAIAECVVPHERTGIDTSGLTALVYQVQLEIRKMEDGNGK